MPIYRALVLAIIAAACIAGCSSKGGTIGGVISAPKFTKGTLSDGRYTAKDKSFSVAVPFPPGSQGYTAMEVTENADADGSQVVFTSSAHPAEVYRVTTFADVKAAARLPDATLAGYRKQAEASSGAPLRQEKANPEIVDGILTISHRFSQTIPDRTVDG